MITYESEATSLGPERERTVSISYLFNPKSSISVYFSPRLPFSLSPLSFSPSFPFSSSFCPSITQFLTISPDPMLILILLPHGSITHFSHFCIYSKERGPPLLFLKPRKASTPIPPKIDPSKPLPHIPSLIVYDFIFNQMWMFLNLRGQFYGGGNEAFQGGR